MTRYYNQNMQKKKLQRRWTIFRTNPPPAVEGSAVYLLAFLMIYQKDYNSIKSKLTFKKNKLYLYLILHL